MTGIAGMSPSEQREAASLPHYGCCLCTYAEVRKHIIQSDTPHPKNALDVDLISGIFGCFIFIFFISTMPLDLIEKVAKSLNNCT